MKTARTTSPAACGRHLQPETSPKVKPFRILAAVLALIAAAELFGILATPTYERERIEAQARYTAALAENTALREALNAAETF